MKTTFEYEYMREIKFRAWDKDNEFMVLQEGLMDENNYFFNFTNFGKLELLQLNDDDDDNGIKSTRTVNCVWMQYTGLKDKNGKEIYEGDIINWTHGGETVDKGISQVVFNQDECAFEEWEVGKKNGFSIGMLWEIEIIGKIYKNLDLIK